MKILVIGDPPGGFSQNRWSEQITFAPWEEQALFELDAVLVFGAVDKEKWGNRLKLAARSGRPVVLIGAKEWTGQLEGQVKWLDHLDPETMAELEEWLSAASRTNYSPIDCNFYDEFEAAMVTRKVVQLEYLDVDGRRKVCVTRLKDTKTLRTEEYLQLMDGSWLRFDRIFAVNGVPAGDSCHF